jgi:Transposase IS116/IS110/IS902 family
MRIRPILSNLNGEDRHAWPRDPVHAAGGRVVSSSGTSVKRSGITKAGNAAARRLVVEAAWGYRFPAGSAASCCCGMVAVIPASTTLTTIAIGTCWKIAPLAQRERRL